MNEDSESNLIQKLSWNMNIKYLKILPGHVGTSSNTLPKSLWEEDAASYQELEDQHSSSAFAKRRKKQVHDLSFVF